MIPIYCVRDQGDVLILAANTLPVLDAFSALAKTHDFDIGRLDNMLVVEQGDAWSKAGSLANQGVNWLTRGTITHAPKGVADFCGECPRSWTECGGPIETASIVEERYGHNRQKNAIMAMRESVTVVDDCPLFVPGSHSALGSLTKRALNAVGLEPVKSVRAFAELGDIGEYEIEAAKNIIAAGVDTRDLKAVEEATSSTFVNSCIGEGFGKRENSYGRRGGRLQTINLGDLTFDEDIVSANIIAGKIRGANSLASRKANDAYSLEHCTSCVYPCDRPPWNMDSPRPLTHEQIMEQWRPIDDARIWMGLHVICGQSGKFKSEYSGRLRHGIGQKPTMARQGGGHAIRVMSLRPPYEELAIMGVSEYWDTVSPESKGRYRDALPSIKCDDDEVIAYAHWALRQLHYLTHNDEGRFVVDGRAKRNDVLSIKLWDNCKTICVGSDTRASRYGGFGGRGSKIDVDMRPRFDTHYEYPYADSIFGWFEQCPGACTGRMKR